MIAISIGEYLNNMEVKPLDLAKVLNITSDEAKNILFSNKALSDNQIYKLSEIYGRSVKSWKEMQTNFQMNK